MRLGIDLDGVCYDFAGVLRNYAHEVVGVSLESMQEADNWHFFRTQWGWSNEQYMDMVTDAVRDGYMFAVGAPMPGTIWALNLLARQGHEIHFVTDRSFGGADICRRNTERWIDDWALPCTSLTIAKDKSSVPVDVFIDDRVENYQTLDAAGTLVYLRTQLWNLHLEDARRVSGWDEFVDAVDRIFVPAAA